jgi:hypothetical protein
MLGVVSIAVLCFGLWSIRQTHLMQVVWIDRVKPGVFLAIAAVLLFTAETDSERVAAWVVSAGQYFVAAAAVIAAAISSSQQPINCSLSTGRFPENSEPDGNLPE